MSALPLPPGRSGLPLLGEVLAFARDPYDFYESRFRAHGPVFRTKFFRDPVVCLQGHEALEFFNDPSKITRENANPPHIQQIFHPRAIPFLGGEEQRIRRALLMQSFTPEALEGYESLIDRVVERYLTRWSSKTDIAAVDELGALLFAVGNGLFAGANPDEDDASLLASFYDFSAGITAAPINLPFTIYGKALKGRKRLRKHMADAVAGYEPGTATHVVEALSVAEFEGHRLDDEEKAMELLHFFGAAFAGLQLAAVHMLRVLAEQPELMDKCASAAQEADQDYLLAVTREARRHGTITPSTFIGTVLIDSELGGYRIPKGWKAISLTHSTNQDPATHEDPTRFDPERFANGIPRGYAPHGYGPWSGHRCAGERLADLILTRFLAAFVQRFRWELPAQDLSDGPGTLAPLPKGRLRIRLSARESTER